MLPLNPNVEPTQKSEKAIDARHSVQLSSERDACDFFDRIKQKLLHVNQWSDYAEDLSATFELLSHEGMTVGRAARLGDYLRIDIPGPNGRGGGEWVMIEDMQLRSSPHSESFSFRVRPVSNPLRVSVAIVHFYAQEATSTFEVSRSKQNVSVAIYDRNTIPNTDPGRAADEIPNRTIGIPSVVSFSRIQWHKLAKGLLRSATLFKFLISLPF